MAVEGHPPANEAKKPLSFLRAHKREIVKLPEPGQRWIATKQEVKEAHRSKFETRKTDVCTQKWLALNCIRRVNSVVTTAHSDGYNVYRTVRCNYERAAELVENEDGPVPGCQHSGIHNRRDLPDGVVSCGEEQCQNTAETDELTW